MEHTTLVKLAVSRPVNLLLMEEEITRKLSDSREYIDSINDLLFELSKNSKALPELLNVLVSTLRALENIDTSLAIQFGFDNLMTWPDMRGFKTLYPILDISGKVKEQKAVIEKVMTIDPVWAEKTLQRLEFNIQLSESGLNLIERAERAYLSQLGIDFLCEDPNPAILIFADVNVNIIDGSSIWLGSVVEACSNNGVEVHVLLKSNIEREQVVGHLRKFPEVFIFEPQMFGLSTEFLSVNQVADLVEMLDGLYGGYRTIIVRGLTACLEMSRRKSLVGRIGSYLTDYYTIDENNMKRETSVETQNKLMEMKNNVGYFFTQTKELSDDLVKLGIKSEQMVMLPPMIPDSFFRMKSAKNKEDEVLKIGYCGKIEPLWGVRELITMAKGLVKKGASIEVHIVGDKIRDSQRGSTFRTEMLHLLGNEEIVTWHGGMARDEAAKIMSSMDVAWCYRDPILEKNTLELSTKLLENMAMSLPFIVTRNTINESLLGENYPLFVDNIEQVSGILYSVINDDLLTALDQSELLSKCSEFSIPYSREAIFRPLINSLKLKFVEGHRIVFAGTDQKFIAQFESYLKSKGHIVRRDLWEWGEPQFIERSKRLSKWADFVFCEWALANAVWYSNNRNENQRIVVRLHSQEIRKRAQKFPKKMKVVDQVVFVSDHIKSSAIEMFDWQDWPIEMIPNYVNCVNMQGSKPQSAAKTIGMVGVVPQSKRIDRALDLINKLRTIDDEWTLIIKGKLPHDYPWMDAPGRSDEKEYFQKQFQRIEKNRLLKEGVIFEGFSPDIENFYSRVSYVLSPSDFESFHFTIADGVSSGAFPVVWPWEGADKLYPKDWIVNDTNAAVSAIIKNSNRSIKDREVLQNESFEYVHSNFDVSVIYDKLEEVLISKYVCFSYNNQEVKMPDAVDSWDPIASWLSKHFHQGAFYEGHMLYAIADLNLPGVYVDVGASLGNHSLFFEMFCPSNKVISFEPLDKGWSLLMQTRKMNNLSFEAHKIGLADKEDEVETTIGEEKYLIKTKTLDSFELDNVSVIKIDIEGMEVKALKGMTETLSRCRPHLFIEAHEDADLTAQESVLNPLGYVRTGRVWNASPTYEWVFSEN
ncbi:MAG: hypothetical protein CMA02_02990 [Euryarchaeota archaeon]|nr:hypothetical protein [Euryarchaeota archaeon]